MRKTRLLVHAKPSPCARLCSFPITIACLLLPAIAWAAPHLGADVDSAALSPEARATELSRLAQAGVQSVRWCLDWNRVEPSPGAFTWEADEAAVNAALAHGLEVVLILGPCAEWAVDPAREVPADQRQFSVPKDIGAWRRYVREAASHFRGRVRHWQVRQQPNLRNFRGTRREFLRLVAAATQEVTAVDPQSLVIMPESGSLDIAEIARLIPSDAWSSFHVLGVYLDQRADGLSSLALPWAVLTNEVLPTGDRAASRPLWVLGSGGSLPAEAWVQRYLLAWALGADRCYLPAAAVSSEWTAAIRGADLTGYLLLGPDVWALALRGEQGPFLLAWSAQEAAVPASALAPTLPATSPPSTRWPWDGDAASKAAPVGGAPGSAVVTQGESTAFTVGPRPVLIAGLCLDAARPLPITRADVLAARRGLDVSPSPLVYADWSMPQLPEFGLRHRDLRHLPGGIVASEERYDRTCVRTLMRPGRGEEKEDNPWIYFDVDDRWLYFDQGKTPVAITVECDGSFLGKKKLGFNIIYDSVSGYRFTPWQWVDAGAGWRRYRVELNDVNFANRSGYDFHINAKGSKQDLWVASVTVEKRPLVLRSEGASLLRRVASEELP